MSDVLALSVAIGPRYASVNNVGANGHRAGKKSDAYTALYADVKEAASQAMLLHGWTIAACECFTTIVRYVDNRRQHDAMNLGKCEFDALTAAGVWKDDALANPCLPMIRYNAPHRVTIVVVKLYESVLQPVEPSSRSFTSRPRRAARAGTILLEPCIEGAPTSPRAEDRQNTPFSFDAKELRCGHRVPKNDQLCTTCAEFWNPNDPIPDGYAILNGKLVTADRALELVRGAK